jgi:hypothetical protein
MPNQFPKRGAVPTPRSVLATAVPYSPGAAAPPNFIVIPTQISFWGNYYDGDCVTAEEAFAKACNNPEIFIAEQAVIAWATAHGVLNGSGLTPVMTWMQTGGFNSGAVTYDDGNYSSVDWTNADTLQSAISQGPVKLGVAGGQLDTTWWAAGGSEAGGRSGWFATGYQDDSAEDHCVSLCGYGSLSWLAEQLGVAVPGGVDGTKPGYALFTWDSIGIIDEPSLLAITAEAWLRQPTTVAKSVVSVDNTLAFIKTNNTPSGHVEVHIASRASNYQTRTLETATTFVNETDGTWQLLSNDDLAFIKTNNTPSGDVEVHIASRASNYETRTVETATTFVNEADGTWQLLVP